MVLSRNTSSKSVSSENRGRRLAKRPCPSNEKCAGTRNSKDRTVAEDPATVHLCMLRLPRKWARRPAPSRSCGGCWPIGRRRPCGRQPNWWTGTVRAGEWICFSDIERRCWVGRQQLADAARLQTVLALSMVFAWRINRLMRLGRTSPSSSRVADMPDSSGLGELSVMEC